MKVTEADAEDCMHALDDAIVLRTGPGEYKAARSAAIELLFWEGRKSITPRPITLWLEPVITLGALARLHRTFGWPKEQLGCQSKKWGFDIVAFASDEDEDPQLLGEIKKTDRELETLRQDLLRLSEGLEPQRASKNSLKKWKELVEGNATMLWLVGPGRLSYAFRVVRTEGSPRIQSTDLDALAYPGAA